MSYTYVALDVETANQYRNSLCAIGLVKFVDGEITDKFYTLINPEQEFRGINIGIHGIHPDDVINAPTFPEVRKQIIDFIGGNIVVAHSAQFDMSVLKNVYEKYHLPIDNITFICSMLIAREAFPELKNHKLDTVSNSLSIELDHHNALSDAQASGLIISHLMKTYSFDSLDVLMRHFGAKPGVVGQRPFRINKPVIPKEFVNKSRIITKRKSIVSKSLRDKIKKLKSL